MSTGYDEALEFEAPSQVDTGEADVSIREIIALLRVDGKMMIEFFLADQLDMDVPVFHEEIWGLMTDQEKERILLTIPRDHAKTTLAKLCVIWYWLYTNHRFCVYLSNTSPIAKAACMDIINFLSHPNFIAIFGKVTWVKRSENEGLWQFDLTMPGGRVKRCILRSVGWGQQMRGINVDNQRPDIAVVDDVEDNDVVDSKEQQKKLDKWMFGPFLKALARKRKIIWLGNMLSKTCLLARLSRQPRWNPVVFGAIYKDMTDGQLKPLWPEKWTLEALREELKEYRTNGLTETWMCEMMNMPGHGKNGFSGENLNYQPPLTPDDIECAWITIDPAFGLEAHNDETCISVHVIPRNPMMKPMTVAAVHGRMSDTDMFYTALGLARYWNAWVWGIESVAAQRVLITLFTLMCAMQRINVPIDFVPLMAGKGDPKVQRIRAWVALMTSGEWAITEDDIDITTQLLEYDLTKKDQEDDIIDSCAYGPVMMEQYIEIIRAKAQGLSTDWGDSGQGEMEICGV